MRLERRALPEGAIAWIDPDWSDHRGLLDLIAAREEAPRHPGAVIHKDDPASWVATVPLSTGCYLVKHYRLQPFRRELGRALRRPKALHSYEMARAVAALGIDTYRPAAVVTEPFCGVLRRGAFLITEALPGVTARQFFADPANDSAARRVVAGRMVNILRRLHAAGFVHGDAKDANFLVDGDRVALIDFDETARPRLRRETLRRKDWRQLMHNWRADPATAALFQTLVA
ncbi:MAG TPA: lipopolysaccharide kinase InaA family protein [Candidatus Acidoferrales bacterium]|nr:lipopolysaccharide kinase InaA family protein [Candidatus Acidoferrales bacterium]